MSKILLSIKPEYVKMILEGTKRYEYRKRLAKHVTKIVIYATAPEKKIVGEVAVIQSLESPTAELWSHTREYSGLSYDQFKEYFRNCSTAYAYALGTVTAFAKPKLISEYGLVQAPQSFVYLSENENAR